MDRLSRAFAWGAALFLAVLALVGVAVRGGAPQAVVVPAFLAFERGHDIAHAVAAVLFATLPLWPERWAGVAWRGTAALFLTIGVLGWLSPGLYGYGLRAGLVFEPMENVLHIGLGLGAAQRATHLGENGRVSPEA